MCPNKAAETAARAAEKTLAAKVINSAALHGGDLSEVLRLDLNNGQRVVAKCGPMISREARMLRAMARAGAPVPEVLGCDAGVLLLEWLEETPATAKGWQAAGKALARLHATTGKTPGWPEAYAFAHVPIDNRPAPTWPAFWAQRRLLPMLAPLPAPLARRIETLAHHLPERLPASPHLALLHGDLWQGNLLFTHEHAWFIDPACYHGDSEVDLAMLALFGPIPPGFRKSYGPERPGETARRPIYQLWPALVHVALFGATYHGLVASLLDQAGA